MKELALVAAGMLLPAFSQAAEQGTRIGVGASIRSDDAAIYLPIDVSPSFRVEPYFLWSEQETTTGGTTTNFETRMLGAGGFFRLGLRDHLETYLGGRLAYVEQESGFADVDGFSVEPTLGVEYFVTGRFSLALEAFLYRRELDGTSAGLATETETTGNGTRLLVRFFP